MLYAHYACNHSGFNPILARDCNLMLYFEYLSAITLDLESLQKSLVAGLFMH